jgi:hypothetical protein
VSGNELAVLSRAHELFAGRTRSAAVDARLAPYDGLLERAAALNTAAGQGGYRSAVNRSRDDLRAAARRRPTPRWPPPSRKPTGITPTLRG